METVEAHQVDNFISLLRQLNTQEFEVVKQFLHEPLRARFERPDSLKIADLQKEVNLNKKIKNWKALGPIYRKMLQRSAWINDKQTVMNVLSQVLLDIETHRDLLKSTFTLELFTIFHDTISTLQKNTVKKVNTDFSGWLEGYSDLPVSLSSDIAVETRDRLDGEAQELFRRIEQAYAMNDQTKLSYLLAQFTGRFCNYPGVRYRNEVDTILEKVMEHDENFQKEVRNRLSVRIYQGVARAMQKGDFKTAVRGITTFILTFPDDLEVPYRRDLDDLSERLFEHIGKYNLWHRVRVNRAEYPPP